MLIKNLGDGEASAPALRFGVVTKHGEGEIVAGTVMMLIGANSRDVVNGVKEQAGRDPEGAARRASRSGRYYDRAEFIERMLKTVAINLAEGAVLVASSSS